VDENRDRLARVRKGELLLSPIGTQNPKKVPGGLIHDWVVAVFIQGASLRGRLKSHARLRSIQRVLLSHRDRFDDRRAYTFSRATRIQEIEEYGAYNHVPVTS
jgi:hypothetical protein